MDTFSEYRCGFGFHYWTGEGEEKICCNNFTISQMLVADYKQLII